MGALVKFIAVSDSTETKAQDKIIKSLGIEPSDIKCIKSGIGKFTFQVSSHPLVIDIQVAEDNMRAVWKKAQLPFGKFTGGITVQSVLDVLTSKGVTHGIKNDVIEREVQRVARHTKIEESVPMDVVIAEGRPASPLTFKAPEFPFDMKILLEGKPLFVRKNDVILKFLKEPERAGEKINGEVIPPPVPKPPDYLPGKGVEEKHEGNEVRYVALAFGKLILEHDVRLGVEPTFESLDRGARAVVVTARTNHAGEPITPLDLIAYARENKVTHGFLDGVSIQKSMERLKSEGAEILVAEWTPAEDGKAGEITNHYSKPRSKDSLDIQRAQRCVVFPGEVAVSIAPPIPPKDGTDIFGNKLHGQPYKELPLYPGDGVEKEIEGDTVHLRAKTYGKISVEEGKVHIRNLVQISKDRLKATLPLFPQQRLSPEELQRVVEDAGILFGYDLESLKKTLDQAYADPKSQGKILSLVVARGEPMSRGVDAKIKFHFDYKQFEPLSAVRRLLAKLWPALFKQKTPSNVYVAPGDLLVTKTKSIPAVEGTTLLKEKIPVPPKFVAKDIEIDTEEGIEEIENTHLEYRAKILGLLQWDGAKLTMKSCVQCDDDGSKAELKFPPVSSLGSKVTADMVKKALEIEGIVHGVDHAAIEAMVNSAVSGTNLDHLPPTIVAKADPARDGEDVKIIYHVKLNDRPLSEFLESRDSLEDIVVTSAECVDPGTLLATRTPPTEGTDGKCIFGRSIRANRGLDEQLSAGEGTTRSADGLELRSSLSSPGYVLVDRGSVVVKNAISVTRDKLRAVLSLFPSTNLMHQPTKARLQLMEDDLKLTGVKADVVNQALEECLTAKVPVLDRVIVEGKLPTPGSPASARFAASDKVTVQMTKDLNLEFIGTKFLLFVRKDQLLIAYTPPSRGDTGVDIYGVEVPGLLGPEVKMSLGNGVVKQEGGGWIATHEGFVDWADHKLSVIPGIFVNEDIAAANSIEAGAKRVFVNGSVIEGGSVQSDLDILIQKSVRSCKISSGDNINIFGDIEGDEKTHVTAKKDILTPTIKNGRVEASGNIFVKESIEGGMIYTLGWLRASDGKGEVSGAEIIPFKGLIVKNLGSPGKTTTIFLGANFEKKIFADQEIKEMQIDETVQMLQTKLADKAIKISDEERKQREKFIEDMLSQKKRLLAGVPWNQKAMATIVGTLSAGVVFVHKDVTWTVPADMKAVDVFFQPSTNTFLTRPTASASPK